VDAGALGISVSATFGSVSDCDSTTTVFTVPAGACSVRPPGVAATTLSTSTPSSTTPVIRYFDLGPELILTAPWQEVKLARQIYGASTSYAFTEIRTLSIEEILNPRPGFVRSGKYSVSTEGGRDISAFRAEFEFEKLQLTKPAMGAALPSGTPPTLEWTGGGSATGPTSINVAVIKGRETYNVACRLQDGKAGAFTIPAESWEKVPAAFRAGSTASLTIVSTPQVNLPVAELDKGFIVSATMSGGAVVTLTP
jgi:hypothetical protein